MSTRITKAAVGVFKQQNPRLFIGDCALQRC
jgi:hypothetical protein